MERVNSQSGPPQELVRFNTDPSGDTDTDNSEETFSGSQLSPRSREQFCKVLLKPPFILVRELVRVAIIQKCPEYVCEPVIDIFLQHKLVRELLTTFIKEEMQNLKGKTSFELFRRDSAVGELFKALIFRVGAEYRDTVLTEEIIQFVRFNERGINIEVSMCDPKELAVNMERFEHEVNHYIIKLEANIPKFPVLLKRELNNLKQLVDKQFPGQGHNAVATIYFFHFFYNAIVFPEFGHPELTVPREARKTFSDIGRTLIFVSTTNTNLLLHSAVLNNLNTTNRQERIFEFTQSLCDLSGHQEDNLFSWCKQIDDIPKNSVIGTNYLKTFTMDNLTNIWDRIIYIPDIAACFFPFICSGFELLQKHTT